MPSVANTSDKRISIYSCWLCNRVQCFSEGVWTSFIKFKVYHFVGMLPTERKLSYGYSCASVKKKKLETTVMFHEKELVGLIGAG